MRNSLALTGLCAVAVLLTAGASLSFAETGAKPAAAPAAKPTTEAAVPTTPAKEPDHITVQHVLIGFTNSVPGKAVTRTQEEAKKLAYEVLDRAKKGENFDELVKKYTDDSAPGIYLMSNKGIAPDRASREFAREGMVAAFGDVGFPLPVGGIGIADYNPRTSPFGWHIIKRIK